MPDGLGSFFDLLDRAAERGLDVRVLFWRPNPEAAGYGDTFFGTPADYDLLRIRGSRFRARWDRAPGGLCQHQKSWMVDAGLPSETAFVGGINLTPGNLGVPGHADSSQRHDAYIEVTGPSASDVHHNFVQRWNEASERLTEDGAWADDRRERLPFPVRISPAKGNALVQIQRTVHSGRYTDGTATPGGWAFDIAGGEHSVLDQYLLAIDAARQSIYIENQAIPVPEVAVRLEEALKRGVEVVMLLPAEPSAHVRADRRDPMRSSRFGALGMLGRYDNFMLAGIAVGNTQGGRNSIYVHAKIMLIDDAWATIGSCNLHANSLSGNAEMNASFWDPEVVRTLRCRLLSEHLAEDTTAMDDRSALRLYRKIARDNGARREARNFDWQGSAFALKTDTYGE